MEGSVFSVRNSMVHSSSSLLLLLIVSFSADLPINAFTTTNKCLPTPVPVHLMKRTSPYMSNTNTGGGWNGKGMSQSDLMNKDECVLVDERDTIVGHDSKYNSHRFTTDSPAGLLHRAFSVFLFDEEGRLLLQQRAADKITFPSVWTNTCCSHQLYGYEPSEVDDQTSIASGAVLGTKAAAIRKLQHELGVDQTSLSIADFKYLTRLHYSAPCADDLFSDDDDSNDSNSNSKTDSNSNSDSDSNTGTEDPSFVSWGESEVDYILFAKVKIQTAVATTPPISIRGPGGSGNGSTGSSDSDSGSDSNSKNRDYKATPLKTIVVDPNPDEVSSICLVNEEELAAMMRKESGLHWSPWFRIIAENFLSKWWADLDDTLCTDRHVDCDTIFRL